MRFVLNIMICHHTIAHHSIGSQLVESACRNRSEALYKKTPVDLRSCIRLPRFRFLDSDTGATNMGNLLSRHDVREQAQIQQAAQEAAMRETKEATERAVAEREAVVDHLRSTLPAYPDFPKKGVRFRDIFPILRDPMAFETLITHLLHHLTSHTIPTIPSKKIDVVVGLDARGFILGPILALRLGASFVPVRKKGKLPGLCEATSYEKEYGSDSFEMQSDAIKPGQSVIIVDDLVATGGSAKAAGELVTKLGGKTIEYLFIIELAFFKGISNLDAPSYSIIQYDD